MGEQKQWRSEIQHGPDGETDYAWVHDEKDALVCIAKSHHATCIVRAVNTYPAVADLVEALELARKRIEYLGNFGHERHQKSNETEFFPLIDSALNRFRSLEADKGGAQ